MKSVRVYLLILIAASFGACSETKQASADTATASDATSDDHEWDLMDEYHGVMADAFHPYKDSANLEPAKNNAKNLVEVANRWADAPLPEKVNNDQMKTSLARLRTSSVSFEETVRSGDDKAIGDSLNHLHDLFHSVQDSWYHAGDEKEHKEHSH